MPTKEGRGGILYVDGVVISEIPEFKIDESEASAGPEFTDLKITSSDEQSITFTARPKLTRFQRLKLFGIYNYCLVMCPNKRVVHLMKYGKNERTRYKNTKRAMRILERINEI